VIGEPSASNKILMTEGYATGATLHELTGLPVVVAFHAGNLPVVAEAFEKNTRTPFCFWPGIMITASPGEERWSPEGRGSRPKGGRVYFAARVQEKRFW